MSLTELPDMEVMAKHDRVIRIVVVVALAVLVAVALLLTREERSAQRYLTLTAEPQGMPLWDLFYFMRSFATWVSRRQGDRDTLAAFERHCLTPSPLSALLTQATERYCDQVGVDKHLVEPLFYTCWLHRALKESILVPADSLQEAHYFNLLRLCIRRRNTPALQALFAETMIGEDSELSRPMSGVGGMNR